MAMIDEGQRKSEILLVSLYVLSEIVDVVSYNNGTSCVQRLSWTFCAMMIRYLRPCLSPGKTEVAFGTVVVSTGKMALKKVLGAYSAMSLDISYFYYQVPVATGMV